MNRIPLLFLLLFSTIIYAQETGEDRLGSWHSYFGTNQIADRWSIHSEIQLRYYEQGDNFNQSVWRLALNYTLGPQSVVTLGYTNLITDPSFEDLSGEEKIREHHIYEDFVLKNELWKLDFQHRYRMEQRFIDFGDRNETQHRIRYRLLAALPLGDIFFLKFYEEVFLNFQNNTFDQNWSYAAFGANLTDNLSAEVGYININVPDANFHRLTIAFSYNPDLRKLFDKTPQ
jgi:hypothetical protein